MPCEMPHTYVRVNVSYVT